MADHGFEETLAPNQYFDRNFNAEAAKILPGEYYVTKRDMLIVTVLGSCVAACIRDKVSGIGGMNHFMLPETGQEGHDSPLSNSARYGSYAMEMLINQLLKLGARRQNLEAKVFGGGNVLRHFTVANIGEKNSRFVIDYLANEEIRIVAKDLLGVYPRKVYFFPTTGRVLVKRLRNVHNNTIYEREKEYGSRLRQTRIEGDVELF